MKFAKTALIFILAILFTIAAVNNAHARYHGDILHWEDFDDISADFWVEKNSVTNPGAKHWQVVHDNVMNSFVYHQPETSITGTDPYVNDWSLYTAKEFRDFTLTLKARTAESLVTNPPVELGVFFNYQDKDNYYYVNFSSMADSTVLIKRVAGVNHVLTRCASPIIEDNNYFAITIKSIRGKILVMAHDVVIFKFYDATFTWGNIGVGVKDDTAYFEDVVLCNLVEIDANFYQDFNDNALTGWRALNEERWSTSFRDHTSYALFLHTNKDNPWNRSRLGEIITIDKIEAKNFKFECDIKSTEGDTARDLALVFCYYDELNYYAAIFHHSKGMSRILRVKNGETSILVMYAGRTLEDYEWHEATVIAQDNHFTVYYDSEKIMEVTDTQLVVGKLGFGSLNDTGYFDNASIWGDEIMLEKITLNSPNGAEILTAGTTHRINWLSEYISNNVALEYSINNGQSWSAITSSFFNKFEYAWTVPEANSTKCRVRVKDVDEYPMDESDRVFTIVPSGNITISSPAAEDSFKVGDLMNIAWTSYNTSGKLNIDFSPDGGSTWKPIAEGTEDDGVYKWITPTTTSNTCLIRIGDVDGFPIGESAVFSIFKPADPVLIQPVAEVTEIGSGKDIWIYIQIGQVENPVRDLFGVSYNLNYAPKEFLSIVEPPASNILPGDFLGTDVIHFSNLDAANGKISVGTSRKYGSGGVSGQGIILKAQFHVAGNIPEGQLLTFSMDEISANSQSGKPITLKTQNLDIRINEGIPVWPGDTNNDGVVNQKDVLPIGQFWALKGTPRNLVSITWQACKCPKAWQPINATYADCNGNGAVDQADILAIGLNWSKTHTVSLFKRTNAATAETIASTIHLKCQGEGTEENPYFVDVHVKDVQDLLGISFNLVAAENAKYVEFKSVQYSEFLGADLIAFESINNNAPLVSIGVSRKSSDGGVVGSGSICRVYFTLTEETPLLETISFELNDITANDSLGNPIELSPEATSMITGVTGQAQNPTEFTLAQNYPNPFNPSTKIDYAVPRETHVSIDIFNSLGQKVKTLVNDSKTPGHYSVDWDGTNDNGQLVSPGIYMVRLQNTENDIRKIKMVLTK